MSRPVRRWAWLAIAAAGATVTAGCSKDQGDLQAFCATVRSHQAALMGLTPSQSPDEVRQDLPAIVDVLDDVVADAPSEVRGAADRLRDLLKEIADVDPDDDAAYGRVVLKLLSEDTARDGEAFTNYVRDNCAVDLSTPTTTAG